MMEDFLSEIELELIDLAHDAEWGDDVEEKLRALSRRIAVEVERIRLAK